MQIDVDNHVNKNVIDWVIFFDTNLQDENNVYKSRSFLA
jgi:hypothetical protein